MSGRPGAIPGAGAEHIHPTSEPKASLSSIGGAAPVPPPSLAFALAALPPRRVGGLLALCALRSLRATRAGRCVPSPLRGSPPCALALFGPSRVCPLRRWRWGAGFWGSLPSLSPAPGGRCRRSRRRWVAGFLVRWLFWGVCRGCSVSLFRLRAGRSRGSPFRPVPGRAVGRFRPGPVVSPFASFAVRLRGGGPVRFFRRRVALRAVVGSAVAGPPRLLRRARGGRWVCGFCAGLPLPAAVPLRPAALAVRSRGLAVRSLPLFPSAAPAVVGFSGSRRLPVAFRPLVAGVVASVLAGGRAVAVGCVGGADAFVRCAAPGAVVFAASAFGSGRAAFAARSVALVRAVAAGGPGSGFVVFPCAPYPPGLSPSASPAACFCGLGSGSWASAAFAAGLGVPVVVFPCGVSVLPPWGAWVPAAASGVWARGFLLR